MSDIKTGLFAATFDDYAGAAQREAAVDGHDQEDIVLFTLPRILRLLVCICRLALALLPSPVIALVLGVMAVQFVQGTSSQTSLALVLLILVILVLHQRHTSPVTGSTGPQAYGGRVLPGLSFRRGGRMQRILEHCPLLTSKAALRGGLPGAPATFWMNNGDIRTLLPFLTNAQEQASYTRRWVRVPVGRRGRTGEGAYEAVALDWARGKTVPKPGPRVVLLILAGLTGGSREGYVLDVVGRATQRGWDCFVMLSRGLGGLPLASGVLFNGARTSDVTACAQMLRLALPPGTKLFVVGVSLGAIIASNALLKDALGGAVDGVVCVSGLLNTCQNKEFLHSRRCWQPLLAHGLLQQFALPMQFRDILRGHFPSLGQVLGGVQDIYDFDAIVVTHTSHYDSVDDYYADMTIDMCDFTDSRHPGVCPEPPILDKREDPADENSDTWVDREGETSTHTNTNSNSNSNANNTNSSSNSNNTNSDRCDSKSNSGSRGSRGSRDSSRLTKPLLFLNALDDPIGHADALPHDTQGAIAFGDADNVCFLVTSTGGHVGWPVGGRPWQRGFEFMSSAVLEFCAAVAVGGHEVPVSG